MTEGRRSIVVLPLFSKDRVIATLAVFSNQKNSFGPREQVILERLAKQIAPAVENARLYSERKQAEIAIQVEKERYRDLVDTIPHGIEEVDRFGTISFANAAFHKIYGYEEGELPGVSILQLVLDSEREPLRDYLRYLVDEQPPPTPYFGKGVTKSGKLIDVEVAWTYNRIAGQVLGFTAVVTDITERKRAEEALRESDEQHRALLDNFPDGVVLEIDRKIAYGNPALYKITGYTEEEILNVPPEEFLVPEERERAVERIGKLLDGTPGATREYRVLKKDGDILPVEVTSQVIEYSGKPALLNILRDITQRKRTEEARQEAEELYRTLVDNSVLGLGVYTPGESIIFSNQRLSEIVGYTKEEYESPEFDFMDLFSADDQELVANNTRRRLAGEPIPPYEVRLITKDKTVKWVEIHNVFVRYRGRGAMQVQWLDVTDRKLAEDRIRDASRLASIGELAAGVAHEINNPLTSVLGFSQLLMAEDLATEVRNNLQKVHSNAQRAAKIVQNLLSFATKRDFRKQYLNVTHILERTLEIKSYDLTTSNIRVTQELSPDIPPTMVDEHQLIQVILNLLTNAEQAIRVSNRKGQIRVRATSTETVIRISIIDDGPGIPPELLSKVFDPFFTTRGVGEGTGLGLSICYGIVRQHDGNLWAENVRGEGAAFHIELPIVGPEDGEYLEPVDHRPQQIAGAMKHLLVVDDEPHIRDLLVRSLEREKYTVDLAKEGEEAWRKLKARHYDCILLDLKMPGMSGQELFRRIEESDRELAKRVIFITGDTISPITRSFLSAAENPVLSKPLNIELLGRQVEEMLQEANVAP